MNKSLNGSILIRVGYYINEKLDVTDVRIV